MFRKKPVYPVMALHALAGFCEDKVAAKRFMRRFLPVMLGCVVAFICFGIFVAIPLLFSVQKPGTDTMPTYLWLAIASFVGFFVILFGGWRRVVGAVPLSLKTGKPMKVYQLEDTMKSGHYELIYVCRESQTYFRIVFSSPG